MTPESEFISLSGVPVVMDYLDNEAEKGGDGKVRWMTWVEADLKDTTKHRSAI